MLYIFRVQRARICPHNIPYSTNTIDAKVCVFVLLLSSVTAERITIKFGVYYLGPGIGYFLSLVTQYLWVSIFGQFSVREKFRTATN